MTDSLTDRGEWMSISKVKMKTLLKVTRKQHCQPWVGPQHQPGGRLYDRLRQPVLYCASKQSIAYVAIFVVETKPYHNLIHTCWYFVVGRDQPT